MLIFLHVCAIIINVGFISLFSICNIINIMLYNKVEQTDLAVDSSIPINTLTHEP